MGAQRACDAPDAPNRIQDAADRDPQGWPGVRGRGEGQLEPRRARGHQAIPLAAPQVQMRHGPVRHLHEPDHSRRRASAGAELEGAEADRRATRARLSALLPALDPARPRAHAGEPGAAVYVILTSKPGQFRTELAEGMQLVEVYDYVFCGRKRAQFVIAELTGQAKVRIVDEGSPAAVNGVPCKFLPTFASVEKARAELRQLVRFGELDASLVRR